MIYVINFNINSIHSFMIILYSILMRKEAICYLEKKNIYNLVSKLLLNYLIK